MQEKLIQLYQQILTLFDEVRIWFFSQEKSLQTGLVFIAIGFFLFFLWFLLGRQEKLEQEDVPEDISEIPLPIMESAAVKEPKRQGKLVIKKHSLDDFKAVKQENAKKVILVVDDSDVMLLQLSRILSKNYMVVLASDGFKALKLVEEVRPDLVLTDIEMPPNEEGQPCSGFDVLTTMQHTVKYSTIPVILMTANLDIAADKGYELGAKGFLSKPFEQDILLEQIEFLLQD